jgi:hypothetical protein
LRSSTPATCRAPGRIMRGSAHARSCVAPGRSSP